MMMHDSYEYNPQIDWRMVRFYNYPKFIEDLKYAIADERSAIQFYSELYEKAPTDTAKYSIKTALEDEKEHNKALTDLYIRLTGHKPKVEVKEITFHHFYDGLKKAFLGEVEAYEFYKKMYLATNCPSIRDLLYDIQHDEMEHATLFNWVHTEIK